MYSMVTLREGGRPGRSSSCPTRGCDAIHPKMEILSMLRQALKPHTLAGTDDGVSLNKSQVNRITMLTHSISSGQVD
jgi:hypothetical protein